MRGPAVPQPVPEKAANGYLAAIARVLLAAMTLVMVCVLLGMLSGCGGAAYEMRFEKPAALADCRIFKLTNSGFESVVVVRCPQSAVSVIEPNKPAVLVVAQ